jgi:hypothetical protein
MSEAQYLERVAVDALGKGLYVAEPDRERFSAAVQSVAEDRSAARDVPNRAFEDRGRVVVSIPAKPNRPSVSWPPKCRRAHVAGKRWLRQARAGMSGSPPNWM